MMEPSNHPMRRAIAVVVLNWNGADDTIACLRSLKEATMPLHVIVVDNGSTDDSLQRIGAAQLADEILATHANLGYAGGNNVGLQHALDGGFEILAVLNNDTVVEPNSFELLAASLSGSQHRAVSPDVRYTDRPGDSWFAGGVVDRGFPLQLARIDASGDMRALQPSEWLAGCCITARRETWEVVGLFDERYFLIFEDADWSMRAVRRGVALYVLPPSTIRHRAGQGGRWPALGGYYFVRNGLRFQARYFPRHMARFACQWLIHPAPGLLRRRQVRVLAFGWLGALSFLTGRSGRAPRLLERLAAGGRRA
jgi:GT2 family glycosyltransferase